MVWSSEFGALDEGCKNEDTASEDGVDATAGVIFVVPVASFVSGVVK